MSINNLHSLINGKWFIHEPYGKTLLPSLFSILEGRSIDKVSEENRPEYHFVTGKKLAIVSGASYNSSNSQNDYVAIISLKDPIYKYDQECGPRGTKSKLQRMASYESDPFCKGVVLDIDSGGGQVSGTPEFYDFIKNFSKPVVSYTDGLMCSAAYYIGSAASYVIANKRADAIGSIGVMVYFLDTTGMYVQKGAKVISEYATKSTEKNRAFEELLEGKPDLYIKEELDPIAEDFINDIKLVRDSVPEEVFAGGTWNAEDSLTRNLIDEIGTLQDAVNKVFELADINKSNNLNNSSMSRKKPYASVQKIIGADGDGLEIKEKSWLSSSEGVFLLETEVDAIEASVAGHESALADEKNKVTTAEGNLTIANAKVTSMESAVNTAITSAGLDSEVAAGATIDQKIALLGAKVVEYGKASGKGVKPHAEGDRQDPENEIVNKDDAHNAAYENA